MVLHYFVTFFGQRPSQHLIPSEKNPPAIFNMVAGNYPSVDKVVNGSLGRTKELGTFFRGQNLFFLNDFNIHNASYF